MHLIISTEARIGRPRYEDSKFVRKSRREVGLLSDPDREVQVCWVHKILETAEFKVGNLRCKQIRFSSVTSLEALILETIRIGGSEICSSPLAQSVMHGTWRNDTPESDEIVNQMAG